ncbi:MULTISPECIES: hypothetical protein [Actinoplanes]|uniref:hypothetical protein n=1 Tax=Actinoplanes TaxID=1865 RepID=UPI000698CD46|nr:MULTISPECIES: hypothetical protein [Actinoplanes]GLY00044.1 hypothetical protein Acsp01_04230 [Actinoplanes sp. NBRC 101535]
MRHRLTALVGAGLTATTIGTAWAAPAAADERGFSVRVTAPDTFGAGASAKTVTAVVTSENRRCRKVRWVMVVRTEVEPGQIRFARIEQDQQFDTETRTDGDTTTITDVQVDPGTSCRGRTVTGTWQFAFRGPDDGDVRFEAQAFDENGTLLSTSGTSAEIEGGEEEDEDEDDEKASPSPSPSESSEPTDFETVDPDDTVEATEPPAAAAGDDDAGNASLVSEDSALLGPGLIVGGVFVVLGVVLLVRLRSRAQQIRRDTQALPTGFYPMPPRH